MIESWNDFLSDFRERLILKLVDFIRIKVMRRMIRRREKGEAWQTRLPPRITSSFR